MAKSNIRNEAADTETSITDQCQVNNSENEVKINLLTGENGQSAVSKIRLNNKVLIPVHQNSLTNYSIGTNSTIANKFLKITTVILDVSSSHNKTFVELSITGGISDYKAVMRKEVNKEGDSVVYTITLFFFQ